jgi:hypothetical protein
MVSMRTIMGEFTKPDVRRERDCLHLGAQSRVCEDKRRDCGDQNTTFQSRFMLTTVMP